MNKFLLFLLTVLLCFYVYSNTDFFYPIQIQHTKPVPLFKLENFFEGKVSGWGIVKKWNGIIRNKIYIDIDGIWEQNLGTIKQKISFDDNTSINIKWKVKLVDSYNYIVLSKHCKGMNKGTQHGNMNAFKCKAIAERDGKIGDYTFDTIMYMIDRHNVIAVTKIKRYGFIIGSIIFNLQQNTQI